MRLATRRRRKRGRFSAAAALASCALAAGCRGGAAPDADTVARLERIQAQLDRLDAQVGKLAAETEKVAALLEPPAAVAPPARRVEGIEIGDSPRMGPDDAAVTIVEFADFECPFCASAVPTLERVATAYAGKVRRVFKHNPMPFHKQAVTAHKAALAAAEEGRFWEMHRLLFAHQDRLDAGAVREHAAALGIDLEVFDAYVASDEGVKAIQADRELARKLGVLGVPAFFVNGRLVAGAQPFEVFSQVIEEELKAPGPER